jgi:hypothetical protein
LGKKKVPYEVWNKLPKEEKEKATTKKRYSAKDQLDLDVEVLRCILKMIGLEDSNFPPIKRMISSPEKLTDGGDLKKKLSEGKVDFFQADYSALDENSKLIENMAAAGDQTIQFQEKYKKLITALAFLSNLYVVGKNYSIDESKMILATQEGAVGGQVSGNLQMHSPLKEALPNSKTELGTVVWLDSIQREIMKDKTSNRQVIVGPASTGKTILIQLKVLEIVETTTNEKVLIILPYKDLEEKYQEFLSQSSNIDMTKRVQFLTADTDDWEQRLEKNKDSHWFIDEFAALQSRDEELCDQIITRSK